jgi:hypothetical protein
LSISKKSSKISFSKNSRKIFINFYVKNGAERPLGDTRGGYHATTHTGGVAQSWPRPPVVRGAHLAPHLSLPPQLLLSPKISQHLAQTRVLVVLHHDFSISLLSPSFLLRFGAFVLRYVTPPFVQVEFLLVKYSLSILAL